MMSLAPFNQLAVPRKPARAARCAFVKHCPTRLHSGAPSGPCLLRNGARTSRFQQDNLAYSPKPVPQALAFETFQSVVPTQDYISTFAASPYRDLLSGVFTIIGAWVWVKCFNYLAGRGILEQKLSRKLVHATAGPLLVLCWPLFSDNTAARLFAVIAPMLNFSRLFLVGNGWLQSPDLVKSVTRNGDRTELLKGPLYYCAVLIAATLLFWRNQPAGLLAISTMCGGDGLADIVGRRFGTAKLPWNPVKSWVGSAAMFIGGSAMATGFVLLFCHLGYFACAPTAYLPVVSAVCLAATIVESLPINAVLDDNLSVPCVTALLGMLLLMPST